MTGSEILFFIFVVFPAAGGYCWTVWFLTTLAWNIKEYFKTRKEYMQKVIEGKEKSND